MRPTCSSALVTPSIWGRLLDDKPKDATESESTMHFDLRRFKQPVARDLDEEIERHEPGLAKIQSLSLERP